MAGHLSLLRSLLVLTRKSAVEDEIDPGDRSADTQRSLTATTKDEGKRSSQKAGKDCISRTLGLIAATPADKAFEERRLKRSNT